MTEEQKAAYINAQSAVLIATISGMNAENMQRHLRSEAIAYDERAFQKAIDASGVHRNAVITLFK